MDKKVLIISGHTDLKEDSLANKTIIDELRQSLPDADFDILSDLYPNYQFNVKAEQDKLLKADVLVLQYPVFWYSTPSLLSKWFEDVFVFGFSHGSKGQALKGKQLVLSLTTGAPETAYQEVTIDDLVAPLRLTAKLTQMDYVGHIVTHGVSYAMRSQEGMQEEMTKKAVTHAQKLTDLLKKL